MGVAGRIRRMGITIIIMGTGIGIVRERGMAVGMGVVTEMAMGGDKKAQEG